MFEDHLVRTYDGWKTLHHSGACPCHPLLRERRNASQEEREEQGMKWFAMIVDAEYPEEYATVSVDWLVYEYPVLMGWVDEEGLNETKVVFYEKANPDSMKPEVRK